MILTVIFNQWMNWSKITTSKYFTPNGNNIHKIGIDPDEEVTFDSEKYLEDETDNQLDYALDFVKKQIK